MGFIRRLSRIVFGGMLFAVIFGLIGARAAKRRIVPVEAADADEIRISGIFEPKVFRSTAKHFKGGAADFWFGGGVIDLREAVLDPSGARLQVRGVFGGGQIVVPETWHVTSHVIGLGGLGDSRPHAELAADAPHLIIEGRVLFGGFAITSEITEQEVRGLNQAVAWRASRGHKTPEKGSTKEPETGHDMEAAA